MGHRHVITGTNTFFLNTCRTSGKMTIRGLIVGLWDSSVTKEGIEETKRIWEATFDQPYDKAGGGIAAGLGGDDGPQNLFC